MGRESATHSLSRGVIRWVNNFALDGDLLGSCIYRLIGYIWGLFEIYGKKLLFAKDVIHKEKTKIYIISKIHDFISILIKTWKRIGDHQESGLWFRSRCQATHVIRC